MKNGMYGEKMDNILTDNGSDFRSYSVERSCLTNGIHINFRPIGKKEYGGHIERLIGNYNEGNS